MVLETPGFVDDKVHNYNGTRTEISTLVSTLGMYSFEDETTNETFSVLYVSTFYDLLRDYYLEYLFDDIKFKNSSDSLKEVLEKNGQIFKIWIEDDLSGDGYIDDSDALQEDLSGDGDFRSPECVEILKECDVVVTNPPFSLFREFVELIMTHNKQFLIIGNKKMIFKHSEMPYFN